MVIRIKCRTFLFINCGLKQQWHFNRLWRRVKINSSMLLFWCRYWKGWNWIRENIKWGLILKWTTVENRCLNGYKIGFGNRKSHPNSILVWMYKTRNWIYGEEEQVSAWFPTKWREWSFELVVIGYSAANAEQLVLESISSSIFSCASKQRYSSCPIPIQYSKAEYLHPNMLPGKMSWKVPSLSSTANYSIVLPSFSNIYRSLVHFWTKPRKIKQNGGSTRLWCSSMIRLEYVFPEQGLRSWSSWSLHSHVHEAALHPLRSRLQTDGHLRFLVVVAFAISHVRHRQLKA
jgi:hypothetical protein